MADVRDSLAAGARERLHEAFPHHLCASIDTTLPHGGRVRKCVECGRKLCDHHFHAATHPARDDRWGAERHVCWGCGAMRTFYTDPDFWTGYREDVRKMETLGSLAANWEAAGFETLLTMTGRMPYLKRIGPNPDWKRADPFLRMIAVAHLRRYSDDYPDLGQRVIDVIDGAVWVQPNYVKAITAARQWGIRALEDHFGTTGHLRGGGPTFLQDVLGPHGFLVRRGSPRTLLDVAVGAFHRHDEIYGRLRAPFAKLTDAETHVEDLWRDVFGNPFRPVKWAKDYCTTAVRELARGIHADGAYDRLPILADAVQDAGCDDGWLLEHLRSGGPHCKGCWAVELCRHGYVTEVNGAAKFAVFDHFSPFVRVEVAP